MDFGTMFKKMRSSTYDCKADFALDLQLIYDNCFLYNVSPESPYRMHVKALKERWTLLMASVPDIHVSSDATEEYITPSLTTLAGEPSLNAAKPLNDLDSDKDLRFFCRHRRMNGSEVRFPEIQAFANTVPPDRLFSQRTNALKVWHPEHFLKCIDTLQSLRKNPQKMTLDDLKVQSILRHPRQAVDLGKRFILLAAYSRVVTSTVGNAIHLLHDTAFSFVLGSTLHKLHSLIQNNAQEMGLEVDTLIKIFMVVPCLFAAYNRNDCLRSFCFFGLP